MKAGAPRALLADAIAPRRSIATAATRNPERFIAPEPNKAFNKAKAKGCPSGSMRAESILPYRTRAAEKDQALSAVSTAVPLRVRRESTARCREPLGIIG